MINLDDCLKKGMLRKKEQVKDRVHYSISNAKRFYSSAEKNKDINEYEMCIIAAYNSAFHCFKALLHNKGYEEKSHVCLLVAVKEFYGDKEIQESIDVMDKIRMSRHEIQYRGGEANEEEAKFVLNFAKELIVLVNKIL